MNGDDFTEVYNKDSDDAAVAEICNECADKKYSYCKKCRLYYTYKFDEMCDGCKKNEQPNVDESIEAIIPTIAIDE